MINLGVFKVSLIEDFITDFESSIFYPLYNFSI